MAPEIDSKVMGYEEIDAMLEAFEAAERKRLNLDQEPVAQWSDPNPQTFTRAQRDSTTILFGGLTLAHDEILTAALGAARHRYDRALFYPKHVVAGTAANTIVHLNPSVNRTIKSHKAPNAAPAQGRPAAAPVVHTLGAEKVAFKGGMINLVPVQRSSAGSAASSAARRIPRPRRWAQS